MGQFSSPEVAQEGLQAALPVAVGRSGRASRLPPARGFEGTQALPAARLATERSVAGCHPARRAAARRRPERRFIRTPGERAKARQIATICAHSGRGNARRHTISAGLTQRGARIGGHCSATHSQQRIGPRLEHRMGFQRGSARLSAAMPAEIKPRHGASFVRPCARHRLSANRKGFGARPCGASFGEQLRFQSGTTGCRPTGRGAMPPTNRHPFMVTGIGHLPWHARMHRALGIGAKCAVVGPELHGRRCRARPNDHRPHPAPTAHPARRAFVARAPRSAVAPAAAQALRHSAGASSAGKRAVAFDDRRM